MALDSFTYLENGEKVYTTILEHFSHRFTGRIIYKIRREGESGWIGEEFYNQDALTCLLRMKVEEE